MELTINFNVSERFCDAIELLAAAISKSNEMPFIGNMTPAVKVSTVSTVSTSEDKVATTNPAIEKLKKELDLVEVEKAAPTLTRAELQAKAARLMQVEKGKYVADLKASLEQCGAANISSLDESMFEKFNSLMADLWEVAA